MVEEDFEKYRKKRGKYFRYMVEEDFEKDRKKKDIQYEIEMS